MDIEEEILKELAPYTGIKHLVIEHNQRKIIKTLSSKFQFSGSKIDWNRTQDHWLHNYNPENKTIETTEKLKIAEHELQKRNFQFVLDRTSKVCYINDSSLNFGLTISNRIFWEIFKILIINAPQHHYFLAEDGSWCLAITMEGFMDYGESLK